MARDDPGSIELHQCSALDSHRNFTHFRTEFSFGFFGGASQGLIEGAADSGVVTPESTAAAGAVIGGMKGIFGAFATFFGIILFLVAFLNYKMGKAYFTGGKKWQIVLSIIFGVLGVLGALSPIQWVQLIVGVVYSGLAVSIYKNPFYSARA